MTSSPSEVRDLRLRFCHCIQLHGNGDDRRKAHLGGADADQPCVAEALDGLPAHKMHCSVLAEEAIKAAVKDYYDKNHIEYDPAIFRESAHEEA